jgi:hypothetical protein
MGFLTGTHNDWGWSARGGDGARQDTPPAVSLFFNPSAAERRARQRARDERHPNRSRAMRERRIQQMRREEAAGRNPLAAWLGLR